MNWVWNNGQWIDSAELPVSMMDRGLLHGLGLFETILAVRGKPVFIDRHLARMRAAGARFGWKLDLDTLPAVMEELLERNLLSNGRARIRLSATGGSGALNDLSRSEDGLFWMQASPLPDHPDQVAVTISPWKRNEQSPLAGLKCSSYAENLVALSDAKAKGFDEVLIFNTAGHLCEGAMSNVFLVHGKTVVTPDLESGCLPGVTRTLVIELALTTGVPVEQRSLTPEDLDSADAVFLTSATRGIVHVTKLDDRIIQVGDVSNRLAAVWRDAVEKG